LVPSAYWQEDEVTGTAGAIGITILGWLPSGFNPLAKIGAAWNVSYLGSERGTIGSGISIYVRKDAPEKTRLAAEALKGAIDSVFKPEHRITAIFEVDPKSEEQIRNQSGSTAYAEVLRDSSLIDILVLRHPQ
jgi:hypothetical protein